MPAKSKRKGSRSTRGRGLRKSLSLGLLLLLACFGAYLLYLNHLIDERFTGDTWALPSRVFSRSLELYPGLPLTREALEYELRLSHYQAVASEPLAGQYRVLGGSLELHRRSFEFSDQPEPARLIQIFFDTDRVDAVVDSNSGNALKLVRLPPLVLGSYYPHNGEDRLLLQQDGIPKQLINILVAVEDRQFFDHYGINPMSILRAMLANIRAGKTVQGGSTLTQQLAKNLFLTPTRSLIRKINEAFMALLLEARFSKGTIITAYINEVFLLQQNRISIHGFALASRMLFRRPLDRLEVQDLAMLVGMVKGPSRYNPFRRPENAIARRNLVLGIMRDQGLIDSGHYRSAIAAPIGIVSRLPGINPFPGYLDLVKRQLRSSYSSDELAVRGLRIFTAFDPLAQRNLEAGLARGLNRFAQPELQAAVILADYLNGDIRALVGDRDTDYPGFNRAVMAQRPIGSLIKPLLLYGFLEQGLTLASKVSDRPIRIRQSDGKVWAPRNFDRKLHGEMSLYQAFIRSYNLPFVHLGVESGLQLLADNLEKIQLLKHDVIYPSILLGTTEMSAYEVAQMYQVIANNGYFTPLTTIRSVTDQQHRNLKRIPIQSHKIFDQAAMIQVQRAMVGVSEAGTASYLATRFKAQTLAGKTGTTNDLRDSWFAGFSQRLLTVVWLGRDDNSPIGLTGSSGALRVWADIMEQQGFRPFKLSRDKRLAWRYIDPIKGGITHPDCVDSVLLPIPKDRLPKARSPCQ